MFGHRHPEGGSRESHGCGNVEGVSPVSSGATGIHHCQIRAITGQRTSPTQHRGHRGKFISHHPFGTQPGKEGTRLNRRQLLRQPRLHQRRRLRGRKILPLQELLETLGQEIVEAQQP